MLILGRVGNNAFAPARCGTPTHARTAAPIPARASTFAIAIHTSTSIPVYSYLPKFDYSLFQMERRAALLAEAAVRV